MSEERAPYDVGQKSVPAGEHEHLYRVAVGGKSIVRYCERCGRTWLVTQLQDILHPSHSEYIWTEVVEESEGSQRLKERSAQ